MGFEKGSISLNPTHDIPLLLQILHSQFITHRQLFEFSCLGCYELNRSTFNWRVSRLVGAGILLRHPAQPGTSGPIYSVSNSGALILAEHCPVLENKRPKEAASYVNLTHSLHLNELHLSLARQGVLIDWQPEIMIRATNELTASGYVKDYDAIVTVRIDNRAISFALEYERTAKKSKDYLRIRTLLEQEDRLRRFMYVVPEPKLASFLLECFAGTSLALFVGLVSDFIGSFREMMIIDAGSGMTKPITAIF